MNILGNASIEMTVERLSQSLTRFDARLCGLEAQYKSTSSHSLSHAAPALFQKSLGLKNQGASHTLKNFLRTGEISSQKSLSSHDGGSGSILLPQMHHEMVEQKIPDYSPLRRLARTTSVTAETLELLVDQGGGDVGWVQEKDRREETTAPELIKIKIPTHEMYARPRATQRLLDDVGIDLESWLTEKISWSMGRMENRAFISGDGEGKPKGFLAHPLCKLGEGGFGKIESLDTKIEGGIENPDVLLDIFHGMNPEYLEGAVWMMSKNTLNQVRKLKDKQGNYLYHGSLNVGEKPSLFGHEIVTTDDMPSPSKDSLSIVFANFSHAYQIVERQDIQVLRDPYSAKPYIEFYATKRVGGDVVNFDALKILRFSKTN